MKVFKFGGASVKDAEGVRNLARVLGHFPEDDLLIVVSAMGKTTNALEEVVLGYLEGKGVDDKVGALRAAHFGTLGEVAPGDGRAQEELEASFSILGRLLAVRPSDRPDQDYDTIVAFGEVWSTLIVAAHLRHAGMPNAWVDARTVVRTDHAFRQARVLWDECGKLAATHLGPLSTRTDGKPVRIVTQGFIGATADGLTTTLGREGSDFSAAIFAYLLDAESVTIWKDVPGMFNADPNRFPDTRLLSHISYREAIELSYFGASVIHPRTLQPLQHRHIPLYVRSFIDLGAPGSTIDDRSENDSLVPSFIVKPGQLLVRVIPRDLSFIVEENLSSIFGLFARRNVRIDLMQNSATAFDTVVDDSPRARELVRDLAADYEVRLDEGCELLTVRHYDDATLERLTAGRQVLIEQRTRATARFVLK